ncbi:DMT family transporter [Mycoplasmatota bacterium WC30]
MPYLGELISLGTALCWTITVISFEYAGKKVGSISVNFIRLLIGFLALGLTLWVISGTFIPVNVDGHAWAFLMISGLIGLVIGDLFLFQSFVDVGGRISLLIMSTAPPLTALLSYIFLNETLGTKDLLGMTITISAIIFVIIVKKQKEKVFHKHIIRGIIFAFIGAIGQSVGLIFSKVGMGDYNAFAATQIRIIAAIIGFFIFISIKKGWPNIKKAVYNKKAMLFITLGSIFGPFLGVSSQLLAMKYTQIGVATTIAQINVILIIPFSIIIFKDKVSLKEIIGSIIAFAGVVLMFI